MGGIRATQPLRKGRAEPIRTHKGEPTMERLLKLVVAMHTRALDARDTERGATATEYALLVAFIALVIVAGVTLFGSQLNDFFSGLGAQVGILN